MSRARQLIENLLAAIRDHRARGVVIDVTGVPIVDTAVANHPRRRARRRKLMGTMVVITGIISAAMAQTLTTLGAHDARTVIFYLQEGLAIVERELGYR